MNVLTLSLFGLGLCLLAFASVKLFRAFARAPKYFAPGYQDPWSAQTRYAFNYLILGPAVPRALQRDYIQGYYFACAAFGLVALGFWAMDQAIYAGLLGFVVAVFALSAWELVRGFWELPDEEG